MGYLKKMRTYEETWDECMNHSSEIPDRLLLRLIYTHLMTEKIMNNERIIQELEAQKESLSKYESHDERE